jgi:hypothetical protein
MTQPGPMPPLAAIRMSEVKLALLLGARPIERDEGHFVWKHPAAIAVMAVDAREILEWPFIPDETEDAHSRRDK